MSRTRIVLGKISINTKGSHFIHSNNDIIVSSNKKIHETGKEKGIIYGSKLEKIDSITSESDLIKDAYWINSNLEKTNLKDMKLDKIWFCIQFKKEAINKNFKAKIKSIDPVLDDDISNEGTYVITKENMHLSFALDGKYFQKGNDAIQKLYYLLEIDNTNHKYPLSENDYLKVHAVSYVPKVMKAQNPSWEFAAKCQERWFENTSFIAPNYANPATDIVKMDWVFGFERIRTVYRDISNGVWKNKKGIEKLKERLREMYDEGDLHLPNVFGQKNEFGDFNSTITKDSNGFRTTKLDKYWVNERVYFSDLLFDPLDDIYGTLANFLFRVSVKGFIKSLGGGIYEIEITKAAIYIIDSFDFNDGDDMISQPLGFWDISNDIISKKKFPGSYYINNQSYKDFRKDYSKGGDFLIISDYEEITDNYKFVINEKTIKN